MNNLGNVIGFTVRNRMRTKAFIVTTIIFVLLITLGANLPYVISLFKTEKTTGIGMMESETGIPALLQAYFNAQEKKEIDLHIYPDQGSAERNEDLLKSKIKDGEIKGYLLFGETDATGFPVATYKSEDTMDFGTMGKLQNGLQQIKTAKAVEALGLTQEQMAMIHSPVQIDKVQISVAGGAGAVGEGKTASEIAIASVMVYALIILLFIAVMVSGQLIATEITAEKSSRVMEVLITSVAPLTQMFGKIIGMFIVGLSQILIFVAAGIVNLMMPHNRTAFNEMNIDLSQIDPLLLIYALIFYLSGYMLYATLFAAVGSIVSRTEDLGQAVTPITMLSMAGYFIAIFGIQDPNSMLVFVTSFIPFFSPFIMFLRVGVTDPALWEVWLSIGLLLGSTLLFGWISAKIYRTGVLMYGKRPTIKELIKAMKAYKV